MGRGGMDRGKISTIQPKRRLGTAAARDNLPKLVQEFSSFTRPTRSLVDRAVEVGVRRQGGAWLVPEVDAQAAIERQQSLIERVAELEELIEDLTAAPVIAGRAATPLSEWETVDEFAAGLSLSDVLHEARAELQ